jgi:hypothetical protein
VVAAVVEASSAGTIEAASAGWMMTVLVLVEVRPFWSCRSAQHQSDRSSFETRSPRVVALFNLVVNAAAEDFDLGLDVVEPAIHLR